MTAKAAEAADGELAPWLAHQRGAVEAYLADLLAQVDAPPALAAAMQDSVLGGGKRLRPIMLFAVAEAEATLPPAALAAACAVEFIHCYSLVHDDMPCMDDDDLRRGKPTCHKAHGEGMALLAGDCLHSLAFEVLAGSGLPAQAGGVLARAAGAVGMGGGQALDLTAAAQDEAQLQTMHGKKTGALFEAALTLGLLCRAQADAELQHACAEFGAAFGLLFQIANDIAGEEKDRAAGKATYATLLPRAQVQQRAVTAQQRACAAVAERLPRLAQLAMAVYP